MGTGSFRTLPKARSPVPSMNSREIRPSALILGDLCCCRVDIHSNRAFGLCFASSAGVREGYPERSTGFQASYCLSLCRLSLSDEPWAVGSGYARRNWRRKTSPPSPALAALPSVAGRSASTPRSPFPPASSDQADGIVVLPHGSPVQIAAAAFVVLRYMCRHIQHAP